jgi:2-polyprenyl-3-methyl-5-hydroxy-6-metoxy-1,4-benzoquinol methylase
VSGQDWPELAGETGEIWDRNAEIFDRKMGDVGNDWHLKLIRPATERLLDVQPDERVLDAACGPGLFSRRLSDLGARVVAFDVSSEMIKYARTRSEAYSGLIDFHVIDATDLDQLKGLGDEPFDAAVANMALMDIPAVGPLAGWLATALRPGGRLVFSVMHPCFQAPGMTKLAEETETGGELVTRFSVKISEYATPQVHEGIAIVGQPVPQHYFHRPLNGLLSAFFEAGFVVDGLEEPAFGPDDDPTKLQSWANRAEIPPVLVVRVRRPK